MLTNLQLKGMAGRPKCAQEAAGTFPAKEPPDTAAIGPLAMPSVLLC